MTLVATSNLVQPTASAANSSGFLFVLLQAFHPPKQNHYPSHAELCMPKFGIDRDGKP